MAIPRLFYAAEREMCLSADRRRIDVRNAVVQLVERSERRVDVPRVQRRRQPIAHAIVDRDRFVQRLHPKRRQHRPENLLLLDAHSWPHAREHRGLEEEALVEALRRWTTTTAQEISTFVLTDLDVALDLLSGAF